MRTELVDLRKSGFVPIAGDLQTGGLLHHMRVSARVDPRARTVEEISAEQPRVAFEASRLSCGESCRDPVDRIRAVGGAGLARDYDARLREAIGGARGCSHVVVLARLLGSSLAWLTEPVRAPRGSVPRAGERIFHRTLSYDGCEHGDDAIAVSFQLTDLRFAAVEEGARPIERLAEQVEVRGRAVVARADLSLRALDVAERRRDLDSLESADWVDVDRAQLEPLVGTPAAQGMRRRVLESLQGVAPGAPRIAALYELAPAAQQCAASLSEHWPALAVRDPSLVLCGPTDSCYMWRADGPLSQTRPREPRSPRTGP